MNSAELTYDNNSGKLDIRFRIPENAEYPFAHHTITKSKSDEYLMSSHSTPLQSSIISEGEKLPDPKHLGLENEYLETREIFMEHLRKFMKERGTPVSRIPQLGHKELDFHLLYKAVIARGGVEQVIRNRQWKEISTMFNFPSTCTNAGYTLRVTYLKFLFSYEQKFFFGKEDVVTHDEAEQMLDLRQNKKICTFSHDNFKVSTDTTKAILSPDGRYACVGSQDGSLVVWNTEDKHCENVLKRKHTTMVTSVAWQPDGKYVASCEKHRQVILWSQ